VTFAGRSQGARFALYVSDRSPSSVVRKDAWSACYALKHLLISVGVAEDFRARLTAEFLLGHGC